MNTIKGTVQRVANTGKSFQLDDGNWYGAFAKSQLKGANVGDDVAFSYMSVTKGDATFNNIKGDVVIKSGGGGSAPETAATPAARPAFAGKSSIAFPLPALDGQRVIVRQNVLSHATKVVMERTPAAGTESDDSLAERIISVAREFEAYVSGELDLAVATKDM